MKIISLQEYRQEKLQTKITQPRKREVYVPAVSNIDANIRIYLFICYIKKEFNEYIPSYEEQIVWKEKCEDILSTNDKVASFYFSKVIENGLDEEELLFHKAPKWFFTWSLHYFLYFKTKETPEITKEELMDKYGLAFDGE